VKLCYNPFFIAMGTTITDFLNPEFVLFGVWDRNAAQQVRSLYATLHNKPFYETSIENAELIKVAYNTYIPMKICYSNTLMEICHKTPGCDVDQVTNALSLATPAHDGVQVIPIGVGEPAHAVPAPKPRTRASFAD
jgi:UDPglucose 6-dehydrogenase